MSITYSSTIAASLKDTLEEIIDDSTDGVMANMDINRYYDVQTMRDAYEDHQSYGGPGLATETAEGEAIAVGTINEGVTTRFVARKFSLGLIVTDEAHEDSKYPEVINATKRLKLSMALTADYDGVAFVARGWNSSYPIADGVSLFNTAHTLEGGGTFSNTMATPLAPSVQAIVTARAQAAQMVGHNGLIIGYGLEKVCFPVAQWGMWTGILGSEMRPDSGNFSEINVIKKLGLEPVEIRRWTSSTTNYFFTTDAGSGLTWKWRRKPRSRSWLGQDYEVEKFGVTARWAQGCPEPRGVLGVQA